MRPTFSSLLVAPLSQSTAALHTLETDGKLEGLEGLPIEIIFDIYQQLDVRSIYSLGQVNTLFHGLLKTNRAAILLPVLQREFSPFPELLQVYTVSNQDLSRYGDTFQPRKVVFRRFPGDIAGVILSRGGFQTDSTLSPEQVLFSKIIDSGKTGPADALPAPRAATLVDGDLDSLLKYCMVVRQWEELYPRLHWFSAPEDCRHLEETEKFKLRRALYRWWLYASYFHGELPRPPGGQPLPFINDIRMSHTRLHPTRELMEIKDLFTCAKQLIRHYIYPILEQKLGPPQDISTLNATIEDNMRERIVDTYAKLDPRDLMFYFENLFNYPRRRLVTDVNLKHPNFARDQQSFEEAVESVILERPWLFEIRDLNMVGSIVDTDDLCEDHLKNDGIPNGTIVAPGAFRQPLSDWTPPGDDGWALTERDNLCRTAEHGFGNPHNMYLDGELD